MTTAAYQLTDGTEILTGAFFDTNDLEAANRLAHNHTDGTLCWVPSPTDPRDVLNQGKDDTTVTCPNCGANHPQDDVLCSFGPVTVDEDGCQWMALAFICPVCVYYWGGQEAYPEGGK